MLGLLFIFLHTVAKLDYKNYLEDDIFTLVNEFQRYLPIALGSVYYWYMVNIESRRQKIVDRKVYLVLDINQGDDKDPETMYCLQMNGSIFHFLHLLTM